MLGNPLWTGFFSYIICIPGRRLFPSPEQVLVWWSRKKLDTLPAESVSQRTAAEALPLLSTVAPWTFHKYNVSCVSSHSHTFSVWNTLERADFFPSARQDHPSIWWRGFCCSTCHKGGRGGEEQWATNTCSRGKNVEGQSACACVCACPLEWTRNHTSDRINTWLCNSRDPRRNAVDGKFSGINAWTTSANLGPFSLFALSFSLRLLRQVPLLYSRLFVWHRKV